LTAKAGEPATAGPDLEKAIAAMRGIDPAKLSEEEQSAKAKALDEAWQALIGAGPAGAERLKAELRKMDAAQERDDFFRLGAASVLWQIGNLAEAEFIAQVWTSGINLEANYKYVFFPAFGAARTQDPRALPMLTACLGDKTGSVFTQRHMLTISWPLTIEFLWGAFGPAGLPTLERIVREEKNPVRVESAVGFLARAQYLAALPRIRELAHEGPADVRRSAVQALGEFGHPQDYEFLVGGLTSADPLDAAAFAYAIYEYEDLRAVPHLVPLLDSPDDALRNEAMAGLFHLLTVESLAALEAHAVAPPAATEGVKDTASVCREDVDEVLQEAGLTWEAYAAKPAEEQALLLAGLRSREDEKFVPRPDDRTLTHDDLAKAAAEWKANNRITGGTYEWVEDRHVLAAATAEDIPLLLEVKAKCLCRLSDECLYETRTLDRLIRRLGRSRYRRTVGVTERVEPLP
jgi:HEAT repeat protein